MTRKLEISVQEAVERRQQLLNELSSDSHKERTETTYYGTHNPFDIPLVDCDTCGSPASMVKVGPFNNRFNILCPNCNKGIQHPQSEHWKAALLWWQKNLGKHSYRNLPLFSLDDLDVPAARRRLAGIRRDLELKKNLAEIDEILSRTTEIPSPGWEYCSRLDAYLAWSMLALALLKREDGGTARLKREEYLKSKGLVE